MDLRLNFARTSTFRESFFVRICPLWNALPLAIRTSERTSVFKTRLKTLLSVRLQSIFDPENNRSWRIICPRGRRRVMMLEDMKEKKELYAKMKERARDRDNWRT